MKASETYAAFAVIFMVLINASVLAESSTQSPAEVTEDASEHKNIVLLKQEICGPFTKDRILDDSRNKTGLFEFPWMALLAYTVRFGSPFRCAGSIINERYVLTAAHCVKFLPKMTELTSVRLGEHNLNSEIDCKQGTNGKVCAPAPQNFDIEKIIPHPDFTGGPNYENDIALLRLSKAADFSSDSVKPICLPIGLSQQTENLDGKQLSISGLRVIGNSELSSVLLQNKIVCVPYEDCSTAFDGKVSISPISQLCAGGDTGDICLGDGGGPLVYYDEVQDRKAALLEGIASFGVNHCHASKFPTVYTRVGHFMRWILDNLKP